MFAENYWAILKVKFHIFDLLLKNYAHIKMKWAYGWDTWTE